MIAERTGKHDDRWATHPYLFHVFPDQPSGPRSKHGTVLQLARQLVARLGVKPANDEQVGLMEGRVDTFDVSLVLAVDVKSKPCKPLLSSIAVPLTLAEFWQLEVVVDKLLMRAA
jgi:hypothetical protein